ncbi:hypothetical protein F4604DRAFT_1674394 [Suillus subluteus]|nr:hypothetical protein F4604DRAFT_1674394 [Suillus subluteus]
MAEEIEAMQNKVMDTKGVENYLQDKLLTCKIAEAAATHLVNSITSGIVDQVVSALTPQLEHIQMALTTLNSTIQEAETLRKNMQHEKEEKEEENQTAEEHLEEATSILYDTVDECKTAIKNLYPTLEETQDHFKKLTSKMDATNNSATIQTQAPSQTRSSYSSIAATNLPPQVDQAVARATIQARQILITLKTNPVQLFDPIWRQLDQD